MHIHQTKSLVSRLATTTLISLAITVSCGDAARAVETTSMEIGVQHYNANRMEAALHEFLHAAKEQPDDPNVHYYLGSVFARMDERRQSIVEFQKAYSLAPEHSQIRNYCRAALAVYGRLPGQSSVQQSAPVTLSNPAWSAPTAAQTVQYPSFQQATSGALPQLSSWGVDPMTQAISSIHNQTEEHKHSVLTTAETSAEAARVRAAEDARLMDQRISEMTHARGYGRRGGYRLYGPADIQEVQNQKAEQQRWNQQHIDSIAAEGQRQAMLTEEAAYNLESQFKQQDSTTSGVRLVPQGTNLFVRNYETFHSLDDDRANVTPLVATPQRLDSLVPSLQVHTKRASSRFKTHLPVHPGARPESETPSQ